MEKKDKVEKESEQGTATERQKKLCLQLYDELGDLWSRKYPIQELDKLGSGELAKHIDHLLSKRREQLNGEAPENNSFNKIEFAMIYKLCWKSIKGDLSSAPMKYLNFGTWVFEEYKHFKGAQQFARDKLKEGGQE